MFFVGHHSCTELVARFSELLLPYDEFDDALASHPMLERPESNITSIACANINAMIEQKDKKYTSKHKPAAGDKYLI